MIDGGDKIGDILGDIHFVEPFAVEQFWRTISEICPKDACNCTVAIGRFKFINAVCKNCVGGISKNTVSLAFFQFARNLPALIRPKK